MPPKCRLSEIADHVDLTVFFFFSALRCKSVSSSFLMSSNDYLEFELVFISSH